MSTKNDKQYVDGYEGLAEDMKKMKKTLSQCVKCKFSVGFDKCIKFGVRPRKYASVLANVKCPERKEKQNGKN